jgi:Rab3 GTPase-activating protein catalytic subunit
LRQIVAVPERGAVAGALFSPIGVHQASKNSLRMGNFLNGHEPFIREIIFAHFDFYWEGQREQYRSDEASSNTQDRVLSQRMYIQGTANDLQLAHSVVSND